ncbi:MAG TPA: tyrosine-type recombinase/integrase [Candidatus Synoicihabitans sp.]|nr:tyrosine-type recombinase/integrase [Candidatus Synoicihabitans sp.]
MANTFWNEWLRKMPPAAREKVIKAQRDVWQACRGEGFKLGTRSSYSDWTRRYALWLYHRGYTMAKDEPAEKIRAFLLWLANGQECKRPLSGTSIKQARHALLFFYAKVARKPVGNVGVIPITKRPQLLPKTIAPEDVKRLLDALEDTPWTPYRLMGRLLFVTGARICDVLRLRLNRIDWHKSEVMFCDGKGGKDRRALLPCSIMTDLRRQVDYAKRVHALDRAAGIPVKLPDPVYHKTPSYGLAQGWAYLFPAKGRTTHPDHGHVVRYRVLEESLQAAVRSAAKKVGLFGDVTPHMLRHCCATQLLEAGCDIRSIQDLLGHESLETTQIYTHTSIRAPKMRSAVDALMPTQ